MSTHKTKGVVIPPFQFRLDLTYGKRWKKAQQQDGDDSLAARIKRIIRKELQQRGIEPKG
ncbi:hypothetical protein DMI70_19060 [Escherichia coli]|nr:hypothetical protein [Escherichia coli]